MPSDNSEQQPQLAAPVAQIGSSSSTCSTNSSSNSLRKIFTLRSNSSNSSSSSNNSDNNIGNGNASSESENENDNDNVIVFHKELSRESKEKLTRQETRTIVQDYHKHKLKSALNANDSQIRMGVLRLTRFV